MILKNHDRANICYCRNPMIGGFPNVIKADEPGLSMRTMPIPALPAFNLRPTVAQWNGYLVIASDDKLVRDMIAVQKGAPGFKSTAEYATLSASLPEQGNSFGVSTLRFADTLSKFQSRMYANQAHASAAQAAFLQEVSKLQNPGHAFGVRVCLPNGMLCVAQSSKGSSQLLAPLVILPAAIGASVAIPAFTAHQHRAVAPNFAPQASPYVSPSGPPTASPSGTPPSPPTSPGTPP